MTNTNFPAPFESGLQISHTIHVPRDNGVWPEEVRVPRLNGHRDDHHQEVVLCDPPLPPDNAVPEPSTMTLFGLAVMFVLAAKWLRRVAA